VLLRFARLDAAERPPVARQRDLATDVQPERVEILVVFDQAVVDVDDVGGDVTVARVPVERRDLWPARHRLLWHRRLAQRQRRRSASGYDQPSRDAVRVRDVNRVLLGPGLESPAPQLLHHVVPGHRLRRRARDVRHARQVVGHLAGARRVGDGEKSLGETVLSANRRSCGAQQKCEGDAGSHAGPSWQVGRPRERYLSSYVTATCSRAPALRGIALVPARWMPVGS
jgi:hypothetical protein